MIVIYFYRIINGRIIIVECIITLKVLSEYGLFFFSYFVIGIELFSLIIRIKAFEHLFINTLSAAELISDFHGSVDAYLDQCAKDGTEPEIAYKGSLNVRFRNKDVHRRAAIYAINHDQSLNSFIEEAVMDKLTMAGV